MTQIDPAGFDALIFDFDGTLVDSMPAHYAAWCATVERFELPHFSEETFYAWGGLPTRHVAQRLIDAAERADLDADVLHVFKEDEFRRSIEHVTPIDVIMDVARHWSGQKPMAIATGATRDICGPIMDRLGISPWFSAVVTADDVQQPKPHPETFLKAAGKLGVSPERCVAYEDTDPGVLAARAAGMTVVDVRPLRAAG